MGFNVGEEKKTKPKTKAKAKSAKEKRRTGAGCGSTTSSSAPPSTKSKKKGQVAREVPLRTSAPSSSSFSKKSPSKTSSSRPKTSRSTIKTSTVTTTVRPATTTTIKTSSGRSKSSKSQDKSQTQRPTNKINEALLTASSRHQNHHGSMSSLVEPLTPTYGDVRTMVCDVSPVPSDVESIDYGGTTQLGVGTAHRGSIISLRRPANRLRSGRANEELTTGTATGLYGAFSRSKEAHTKASGVPRTPSGTGTSETKGTGHTNDVVNGKTIKDTKEVTTVKVIDHDNNDTKSNPTKQNHKKDTGPKGTTGQAKTLNGNSEDRKKGTKDKSVQPKPNQQPKSKQNIPNPPKANNRATSNKTGSNSKTQAIKSKNSEKNEKQTSKDKKESRKMKSSGSEILPMDTPNISITFDGVQCEQNKTESEDIVENIQETEKFNAEEDADEYNASEEALNVVENIPADEECRKAFTVLNCKGFKVSLHTLRRALLTPTEYRLLRSERLPSVKTEQEMKEQPIRSKKKTAK